MRELHPDYLAAITSTEVIPALLCFLDIAGEPVRMWTGVGSLHYAGESWIGIGSLAQVDAIEEYEEIRAGSVNLSLTGVPNHALSSTTSIDFKNRAAILYLAVMRQLETGPEIIGVQTIMRGSMDVLTISRKAKSSTLKLSVVNELARLKEAWGKIYTDDHQQSLHPGDTSLRFVASIQDVDIWI